MGDAQRNVHLGLMAYMLYCHLKKKTTNLKAL